MKYPPNDLVTELMTGEAKLPEEPKETEDYSSASDED
jgi:hypothetical protein